MAPSRTQKWFKPTPEQKKIFDQAKDDLRMALLCCKEGIGTNQIQGIVEESGVSIPYKKLGFSYFEEFLFHIDDILEVRMLPYNDRKFLFFRESAMTENDAYMREMVRDQASTKTRGSQVRATLRNTKLVPSDVLLERNPQQRPYQPVANMRGGYSGRRGNVRYRPAPRFMSRGGGISKSSGFGFSTGRSTPYSSSILSSSKPTVVRTYVDGGFQTTSSLNDVKNTFRSAQIPTSNSKPVEIRIGTQVVYPDSQGRLVPVPPKESYADADPDVDPDDQDDDMSWDEVDNTQVQHEQPQRSYQSKSAPDPIRMTMASQRLPLDEDEYYSDDDEGFEMFCPSIDKLKRPEPVLKVVNKNMMEDKAVLNLKATTEDKVIVNNSVVENKAVPNLQPKNKENVNTNVTKVEGRNVPIVQPRIEKVVVNKNVTEAAVENKIPDLKFKIQLDNYIQKYQSSCQMKGTNGIIPMEHRLEDLPFNADRKYPVGLGVNLDWKKELLHNPGLPIPYVRIPLWNIVEFKLAHYEDPENFMITRMFVPPPGLAEMNIWYQNSRARMPQITLDNLLQNGLYAGFCRKTGKWIRIQVDLRQGVLEDKIDAIDIDMGIKTQINLGDIKYLKPKFSEFPRTAFLADVFVVTGEPKGNESVKREFNKRMADHVGKSLKTLVAAQIEDAFTGIPFLRTRFFVFGDFEEMSFNYSSADYAMNQVLA